MTDEKAIPIWTAKPARLHVKHNPHHLKCALSSILHIWFMITIPCACLEYLRFEQLLLFHSDRACYMWSNPRLGRFINETYWVQWELFPSKRAEKVHVQDCSLRLPNNHFPKVCKFSVQNQNGMVTKAGRAFGKTPFKSTLLLFLEQGGSTHCLWATCSLHDSFR